MVKNPETGADVRELRYRLKDNYARFYLKFVEPVKSVIDAENGVKKGPFQYRIWFRDASGARKVLVDASRNTRDLLVDYREVPETKTQELELEVLGGPKGIKPGVVDFSPFGE